MKRQNTKKNFNKFTSRAKTHERKKKQTMKNALARAVAETGTNCDGAKFRFSDDGGKASRNGKPRRDERTLVGRLSVTAGGFGFVTPEPANGETSVPTKDVFIPDRGIGSAMSGDLVEVSYHIYTGSLGDERTEGRVSRILEYGKTDIVGTLVSERCKYRGATRERFYVIPDDPSSHLRPYVREPFDAEEGDKVEIRLLRDRGSMRYMEGEFLRSFGQAFTKEANYSAILADAGIPEFFTDEELSAAETAANEVLSEEGRVVRKETVLTIDGEGAKDLDDAVSLRKLPNGRYLLGVHIADVSHYVKEKTVLDRLVMARGTSVYFTDKVVPMLPPSLSNGACSLHPGAPKYTLSAMITLTAEGEIENVSIEPSLITSKVRGVYSEVNALFRKEASPEIKEKYKAVRPMLEKMHSLYEILKAKSEKRGALEMEDRDIEILLGEDGLPKDVHKVVRGDAERMIEQFMLCANEAVARFLTEREIPCVYRVHGLPPEDKRDEFLLYAHNLGLKTPPVLRINPTAKDYRKLLEEAQEKGLSGRLSYAMLRSMAKAVYSDVLAPHFGLSVDCYCHFTSPIRRLSDLATHRIIHRVLLEEKGAKTYASYAKRAAAAATEGELRALSAERRIEALYKTLFMYEKIGQTFQATVSGVASFGLFAELENGCEGLIPIDEMPESAFFDAPTFTLRTRSALYRMGDALTVRVEDADIIRGKVRFSVVV